MKKILIALTLLLSLVLVGCNSTGEVVEASISFSTDKLFIKEKHGVSLPMTLEGIEENEVSFTFSNEDVVYIEDMIINAVNVGYTKVTAFYKNNNEIISSIDIYVESNEVKKPLLYSPTDLLNVNGSTPILFDFNKVGAFRESFSWTVSNEEIATIDENFVVTGLKEGEVTITATLKSNPNITSSYKITISDSLENRFLLNAENENAFVQAGEYMNLFIDGVSDRDDYLNYRWQSYSNGIATVTDDGRVVGYQEGVAKIAAFSKVDSKIIGIINVTVQGVTNVDYRERLVQVALAEEGYIEGDNSDSKYGEWYGLNHHDWCAMFVVWSSNQAGIPTTVLPKFALVSSGKEQFIAMKAYKSKEEYIPQRGDVILFLSNGASHTGIVTGTDNEKEIVYTIEGNTSNRVAQRSYSFDDPKITGYGIPKYPEYNPNN